jgi:K+-sensing histidine kinase KdpD
MAQAPVQAAGAPAAASRHSSRPPWLNRNLLAAIAGLGAPLALTAILIPFRLHFPNTDAALALLLLVVAVAAAGSRLAGWLAAASAAAWFDFFLTAPYERFSITTAVNIETTVLLLVIGVAVTEIAAWGRRQHVAASRRSGYLEGINSAARAAALGESPPALIDRLCVSLTQLLGLRSCQFQYGMAGLAGPARLDRDGRVWLGGEPWDVAAAGLPAGPGTELLVESGGWLQGRFLLQGEPDTRPTREQLLVAVAFADQVGAALSAQVVRA